jgi:hypothetical protein
VGYISPDEQAKRLALAKQADQGMNMNISTSTGGKRNETPQPTRRPLVVDS